MKKNFFLRISKFAQMSEKNGKRTTLEQAQKSVKQKLQNEWGKKFCDFGG